MINLHESLLSIPHIFESRYTFPLPNEKFEDKKKIDLQQYHSDVITAIKNKYGTNSRIDEFIGYFEHCYDAWDKTWDRQTLPVVFDTEGHIKFRRKYMMDVNGAPQSVVGDGSLGLEFVSCKDQENATVKCWNEIFKGREDVTNDYMPSEDEITKCIGAFNLPDSWVKSCIYQCIGMYKYIKSFGNPHDYRAVRYGEQDEVAQKYESLVKSYIRLISPEDKSNINRNIVDPTDIILYKENGIKWDDPNIYEGCRRRFIDREVIGVALKKVGKIAKILELNINPKLTIHINDFEFKNDAFIVTGRFKIDGLADAEEPEKLQDDLNKLKLCLRSFGNYVGMEVTEDDALASLGKVPVEKWKREMKINGIPKKSDLVACTDKFKKLNKSQIQTFINEGIKCGPNHLPFVLIH